MTAPATHHWLHDLGPGIVAASCFAASNILSKVVMTSGMDVLSLSLFRGIAGVAMLFVWMRLGPPLPQHSPKARWISLGLGVVFAGVVVGLFAAFHLNTVPIGILSYFVYPLITGAVGALLGIEKIGWRGALAALAAFCGLALMLQAHPQDLAWAGIAFSFMAAVCRTTILLVTRSMLQDCDPLMTTWYTLLSSTAVLAAIALAAWNWHSPQSVAGWLSLICVSVGTLLGVLALFVSIKRIGPFRSALVMHLEPLLSTVLSAPLLGETITPVQALGGAIMLAALVSFQLRR